jgi:uncharacterized phosphosugar-binding protein
MNERDFLTFGTGHSESVAREAMWRAGGLAPALAIHDHTGGDTERIEGVAALILGHYSLREGSAIVVISNSGINAVPIEGAMLAKAAGLTVIVITALAHSQNVPARHSSGNKLYEVGDIVIDTHTPTGDNIITLPNSQFKAGSTSTLAGIFIMEAMTTQAAAIMDEQGFVPPVLLSNNAPDGDTHNLKLKQKYMPRMVRFPVDTADMTHQTE